MVAEAAEAPPQALELGREVVREGLEASFRDPHLRVFLGLVKGVQFARRAFWFWAPYPWHPGVGRPFVWALLVLQVPQPLVEVRPQLQAARCRVLDQQEAQEAPQEAAPVRSLGRRHRTFLLLYYNHFKIVLQFPIISRW